MCGKYECNYGYPKYLALCCIGSSGHYTAHCLNLQNNKWYLLNDSNECSELSKSEIFGSNNTDAYILFYERIDEQQQRIDEQRIDVQ